MITIIPNGNILTSTAHLLICPVNTVPGVMGKGLALAFAKRWPELPNLHRKACLDRDNPLQPGGTRAVVAAWDGEPSLPRIVLFAATKHHWRDPSRMEWIEGIISRLGQSVRFIENIKSMAGVGNDGESCERFRSSIAIPAIGCGLGGLNWEDVEPKILRMCVENDGMDWEVYPPHGVG